MGCGFFLKIATLARAFDFELGIVQNVYYPETVGGYDDASDAGPPRPDIPSSEIRTRRCCRQGPVDSGNLAPRRLMTISPWDPIREGYPFGDSGSGPKTPG